MKTLRITEHSFLCDCSHKRTSFYDVRTMCELNPKKFLFLFNAEFYLIKTNRCFDELHPYCDTVLMFLENLPTKKTDDFFSKTIRDSDLKKLRENQNEFKNKIFEVCFEYSDSTKKKYRIVHEQNLLESSFGNYNKILAENYERLKEEIKDDEFLLKEAKSLYYSNYITDTTTKTEVFKTFKHLQQKIKNYATSK